MTDPEAAENARRVLACWQLDERKAGYYNDPKVRCHWCHFIVNGDQPEHHDTCPVPALASLLQDYDAQAKHFHDEGYMHPDAVLEIEMRWQKQYDAQAKRIEALEGALRHVADYSEEP